MNSIIAVIIYVGLIEVWYFFKDDPSSRIDLGSLLWYSTVIVGFYIACSILGLVIKAPHPKRHTVKNPTGKKIDCQPFWRRELLDSIIAIWVIWIAYLLVIFNRTIN